MYELVVSTNAGYRVATFQAGNTILEANRFYKAFIKSGLYQNYKISIKTSL